MLATQQPTSARAGFFSTEDFAIAVGAEYFSLLNRRGMVVYDGFQLIPIYSVNLFNPDLQLVGSTLNYRKIWKEQGLVLRGRVSFNATNDSPFYVTSEGMGARIRRQKTIEVETFLEWRAAQFLELSANISQDIVAHGGLHGALGARLIFGEFFQKEGRGAMAQLAFFGTLGVATGAHNDYLYGSGSQSGLSYYTYGFSVSSPAVIDTFYPVFKLTRTGVLGDRNRSATHVRTDEQDSWQILALAAFRIW